MKSEKNMAVTLAPAAPAPTPVVSLLDAAGGGTLLFRQLFDADTGTSPICSPMGRAVRAC
jgi:hypothetical protein